MTSMIFCIQLFTKNLIKKLNNSSAIIPIDARAKFKKLPFLADRRSQSYDHSKVGHVELAFAIEGGRNCD